MQTLDLDLQRLSGALDEDLISPECLTEVCEAECLDESIRI
jgi:hypothetical protein